MFGIGKKRKNVTKATVLRIMTEVYILFWVMIIIIWENSFGFYFRVFLFNAICFGCYFLIEYWDSDRFRYFRTKLRNLMTNNNESV